MLPLEFPSHQNTALGRVNGADFRYDLTRVSHGCWHLTMDFGGRSTRRQFTSERKARKYARDNFRRRQILKVAT